MMLEAAEDPGGAAPDKGDLLGIDYSLNGAPFVHVTGRANIDTMQLGYSLDGAPFIGVSR